MKSKRKQSERWAFFGGLALTVSGVAHLVCPPAFEPVNRLAFKDNIRAHGQDENLGVESYYRGVEFFYRYIKAVTAQ